MKSVGQTLFELSRYNEVWTDRQTDKVITKGLPHLRWRGPNKTQVDRPVTVCIEFHSTAYHLNVTKSCKIYKKV